MKKRDMKRYRKLARAIHTKFCDDRGWCNYGEKLPPDLADDESLSWSNRQELAGMRLAYYHHCQAAVDAENIAARFT